MNKGLTSFRALAFFAIFSFHISNGSVGFGYIGVLAFFVLSGFLLTPILVNMKSNLNKKDFFIHFYGRRALRIFPLYYSYVIIVASLSFLTIYRYVPAEIIPVDRLKLIAQLNRFIEQLPWTMTYTYDFLHASKDYKGTPLATHLWSLAVEEQFYLVWPLAIFFIPPNYLKKFLLFVIMAGPFIRLLLAITLEANLLPALSRRDVVIYVLPFSHLDAFALGGYFSLYGKSRPSYFVWVFVLLVLMLGLVTSGLSTDRIYWDQLGYEPFMRDSYKYIWGYSVVNLMFAYMLVHIRDKTFMPALLENPFLVYLGTISYGLYVFHLPIQWLARPMMHGLPEIVQASTILLITTIISVISYEFMEKRFINAKDKCFARTPADK